MCAFRRVRTNFLPGACNSDAVLGGDLGRRVGTRPGVLREAEVIIRAQVNHILHYPTRVPGREKEEDDQTEETINDVIGTFDDVWRSQLKTRWRWAAETFQISLNHGGVCRLTSAVTFPALSAAVWDV